MFKTPFTSRLALALALPTLGALALSSSAQANVRNTTPGSVCQFGFDEIRGGVPYQAGDPRFTSAYTVEQGIWWYRANENNTSIPITCPVMRNLPLSTEGLSDLEVRFRSVVVQAPRTVTCTAYSVRADGAVVAAVQKQVTVNGTTNPSPGNPNTAVDSLATMDFGKSLPASASKGHYVIGCSLPPGVGLMSIYTSENGDPDTTN